MKHLIVLGLLLVLLSAVSYLAHYAIFGDAHHIFIYLAMRTNPFDRNASVEVG